MGMLRINAHCYGNGSSPRYAFEYLRAATWDELLVDPRVRPFRYRGIISHNFHFTKHVRHPFRTKRKTPPSSPHSLSFFSPLSLSRSNGIKSFFSKQKLGIEYFFFREWKGRFLYSYHGRFLYSYHLLRNEGRDIHGPGCAWPSAAGVEGCCAAASVAAQSTFTGSTASQSPDASQSLGSRQLQGIFSPENESICNFKGKTSC